MSQRWLQIRGDPSVRRFVFEQERVQNDFDQHLDQVLNRIETLFLYHGVFHAKVHFSTGQVTLWLLADPLRYRVHLQEELLDEDILSYPRMHYTDLALVAPAAVTAVLGEFKRLRMQDRNIYLRAGSLNVINGCIGLNFSCDGSHYLDYAEFLKQSDDIYS